MRYSLLVALTLISGCSNGIYLRDGVTDGDTFYLAPVAWTDNDPALQSWVAYSLARSTCQLRLPGDNPARTSSYSCELAARRMLVDTWAEKQSAGQSIHDDYLDALLAVQQAGYLDAYTAYYFGRRGWIVPGDVDSAAFGHWRRQHLRHHRPQTRMVGYWLYADQISAVP